MVALPLDARVFFSFAAPQILSALYIGSACPNGRGRNYGVPFNTLFDLNYIHVHYMTAETALDRPIPRRAQIER